MDAVWETLTEIQLNHGHVIKPQIVGVLVSIVCSVIGCFIVLRKMSFLADAIAHSMLAGVIGGYLLVKIFLNQDAKLGALLLGAIIAGIVTVALVGFVTKASRLKQDAAIGIMYSGIFAAGAMIISIKWFAKYVHIDIYHYIVGNIIGVSNDDLWLLAIVTALVLSVVILFYRQLQLTSFDPIMAASIGIPVLAIEYLLTACTSLVVVSGVQMVGVILVIGLMITPAASAYLLTNRLDRMIWVSVVIGVTGFLGGFQLASILGADPGPTVVVMLSFIFLGVLTFSPTHGLVAGWVRRRNAVPMELMEDVLGSILRHDDRQVPMAIIEKHVKNPNIRIRRAIQLLAKQQLLTISNGSVELTPDGQREATRLVRAHRLWETYLEKLGMEEDKSCLHDKAHQLEHISDQATVEYLDDRLGHPLEDPHGATIPLDEHQLAGERPVKVSVLRNGHRVRVQSILANARSLPIRTNEVVTVGERRVNNTVWTLVFDDGQVIELSHDQADAVLVKVEDN